MRTSRVFVRFLCLLLCLTVLLPCVSALAETTKVAAYLLRLRKSPSSTSEVLDAFPRGTVVTILKKGDEWTKVKVHGKVGYMQTNLLSYGRYKSSSNSSSGSSTSSNSSSGSSSSSSKKSYSGTTMYVMKGIKLNLREEADSNSEIIASFRGGTPVTVIRRGKYWSYVEVKGLVGYMGNDYLVDYKE